MSKNMKLFVLSACCTFALTLLLLWALQPDVDRTDYRALYNDAYADLLRLRTAVEICAEMENLDTLTCINSIEPIPTPSFVWSRDSEQEQPE
jgi:hypothetical protein